MKRLKKYFISGLLFIIPISLSLWILFKIIIFFENIIGAFLRAKFPLLYIPGIGFISLILIILLLGFLADNLLGKKILAGLEKLFRHIPVINKIYLFVKNISQSLIHGKDTAFREVVKIEFFSGTYTIGFITGEARFIKNEKFISIFVPTVPNISTGFYILAPENKIERLNLSVEDAIKTVVSMGIFESKQNGSGKSRSDNPEKE